MKYQIVDNLLYVTNNEGDRVLMRRLENTQWHTPATCAASLFELQDAIHFAIHTPYSPGPSFLESIENAPIGSRLIAKTDSVPDRDFYMKVGPNTWAWYRNSSAEQGRDCLGKPTTSSNKQVATLTRYKLKEPA